MQVEMSRSEFKRRIYGLIKEGHGSGVKALLLRWEAFSRPFFKTKIKFSPAVLYSNTLWLKPGGQSEFDFLVALLKHMGEGTEALRYLKEMHYVEQERYFQMQAQLIGVFQSIRFTRPAEAVARLCHERRRYVIVDF